MKTLYSDIDVICEFLKQYSDILHCENELDKEFLTQPTKSQGYLCLLFLLAFLTIQPKLNFFLLGR